MTENAFYCLAVAIESFFTSRARPMPGICEESGSVVFSLSTVIIMHCYARERKVVLSKYLNVLEHSVPRRVIMCLPT